METLLYDPAEFMDSFGEFKPHAIHKRHAELLTRKGLTWLYKPCAFPLRVAEEGSCKGQSYTPTFYVPAQERFIHVIATYSGYYDYRSVFKAFRDQYPQHTLVLVNYTGQQLAVNEKNVGKTCSVVNCEAPAIAKGMCRAHYYKWKRGMINPLGKVVGVDLRTKEARATIPTTVLATKPQIQKRFVRPAF